MNSLVGSLLPPAERPFGKYELISKLATGGMAEIFLASELVGEERRLLVIKRVLPHLEEERRFLSMFQDEARLASQIIHPNVCRVYDWGDVDETYFMALEYLHGVPLSRMFMRAARTHEHLAIDLLVSVIIQCARGLQHAHDLVSSDGKPLDVVHRDVSPPNIFVTSEGLAKLLDFGVAKARGATQKTRTGTVKGKNSYMSPEQILGNEVDRRSDIFSLGIVLWEGLSSKRLFSRATEFETFRAITEVDIPDLPSLRPEVGDALNAVTLKALAKEPEDRYSSAEEFADALQEIAEAEGGIATSEAIGSFIRERFARDLRSRRDLTVNLTEKLAAVYQAPAQRAESNHEEESRPRSERFNARTVAMNKPARATEVEDEPSAPASAPGRLRLLLAGLAGLAVLGLVSAALLGGGGRQESKPAEPGIRFVYLDAGAAPEREPDAFLSLGSSLEATIFVDGVELGTTPIERARVAPGPHTLRAVLSSGEVQSLDLTLEPGQFADLEPLVW